MPIIAIANTVRKVANTQKALNPGEAVGHQRKR
jgi:hypothetical protein